VVVDQSPGFQLLHSLGTGLGSLLLVACSGGGARCVIANPEPLSDASRDYSGRDLGLGGRARRDPMLVV
jgi:hypothetical protein